MCGPPLLIGLTTACFRHRRRPSCAPLQFPLKSYGFPGAETARKRFLLWKMGFSAAKIAPSPPYTPPGTIEARKGSVPQGARFVRPSGLQPLRGLRCSQARLWHSLLHWGLRTGLRFAGPVFRGCGRPLGVSSPLHPFGTSTATACFAHCARRSSVPIGLTSRCFAHSAHASCATLALSLGVF